MGSIFKSLLPCLQGAAGALVLLFLGGLPAIGLGMLAVLGYVFLKALHECPDKPRPASSAASEDQDFFDDAYRIGIGDPYGAYPEGIYDPDDD